MLGSIRVSCVLYVAALLGAGRVAWIAAFVAYLAHIAAAFTFRHHWSHDAAYRATGFGIWFNYAFTALWFIDIVVRAKPRWVTIAIHSFLAFMFFNAAVIFATGWTRWLGAAATVLVAVVKSRSHGNFPPSFSRRRDFRGGTPD